MNTWLRQSWQALRTIFGDDAYERYLAHCQRQHPDEAPLDRRTFYRVDLERRWSGGPNRCC